MIFPLFPVSLAASLPYPGGPTWRDMPYVNASVENGTSLTRGMFLVDTGADSVVLPEHVAGRLHIDLTAAPTGYVTLVGGGRITVRYAEVTLALRSPAANCRWRSWAAFGTTTRWLLGHFGGLEYFHFSLDPVNEEFMLVPRDSLPRV